MKNVDVLNDFINKITPANVLSVEDLTPKNNEKIEDLLKNRISATYSECPNGFYVTKSFFSNISSDKAGNIYEKSLPEKSRKQGRSDSEIIKFNDKFLSEVATSTEITTDAYFFVIFPLIIAADSVVLLYLEIKQLPFDFNFFFFANSNTVTTTPKINGGDLSNLTGDGYNSILNKYLDNSDFAKNAYTWKIYKVAQADFSLTYSDFINFLMKKDPKKFNDITSQSTKLGEITISSKDNQLAITLPASGSLQIKNVKESADAPQVSHNKNAEFKEKYWQNFLGDGYKQKKTDNHKLTFANYIDISFDCKNLKPFIFSNSAPGFHVIEYLPAQIYTSFSNSNSKEESTTYINIFEVYKALFVNKIIEVSLDKIDL